MCSRSSICGIILSSRRTHRALLVHAVLSVLAVSLVQHGGGGAHAQLFNCAGTGSFTGGETGVLSSWTDHYHKFSCGAAISPKCPSSDSFIVHSVAVDESACGRTVSNVVAYRPGEAFNITWNGNDALIAGPAVRFAPSAAHGCCEDCVAASMDIECISEEIPSGAPVLVHLSDAMSSIRFGPVPEAPLAELAIAESYFSIIAGLVINGVDILGQLTALSIAFTGSTAPVGGGTGSGIVVEAAAEPRIHVGGVDVVYDATSDALFVEGGVLVDGFDLLDLVSRAGGSTAPTVLAPPASDAKLYLEDPEGAVAFGPNEELQIARTEDGRLSFNARLLVNGVDVVGLLLAKINA